MPRSRPIDDGEALRAAMTEILAEAHANDIEIEGGWTLRTGTGTVPDLEVQVWEIE